MSRDPRFPPVEWNSPLAPWRSRNYVPGSPHNLPAESLQPRPPNLNLIGGSVGEIPTPSPATAVIDAHRYADVIEVAFAIATASALLITQSAERRNLLVMRNTSASADVYVSFGGPASSTSLLLLTAGQTILFDTVVPQDDIYAAGSAAGSLTVGYSTIPNA